VPPQQQPGKRGGKNTQSRERPPLGGKNEHCEPNSDPDDDAEGLDDLATRNLKPQS